MTSPIYSCLWFENQAKEAADFYCGIFPSAKIISESSVVVHFELNGTRFMALNGRRSPIDFSDAISLVITCEDQAEIDHYWVKLNSEGGTEKMCGWCTDKFGVSWQVVPAILGELMNDPVKGPKAVEAFMKMKKFVIEELL